MKNSSIIDSQNRSDPIVTIKKYPTPAQDTLNLSISFKEKQLIALIEGRDSGLAQPNVQKEIDSLRKKIKLEKKKLKTAIKKASNQKKYRLDRNKTLLAIKSENPKLAKKLHVSIHKIF